MIKELVYKWFGLVEKPCETCEVLRQMLANSERERRELLARLLNPPQAEPVVVEKEEPVPITPQFVPWRVRQQMFEAEDRKRAELIKQRNEELEKELGIKANEMVVNASE